MTPVADKPMIKRLLQARLFVIYAAIIVAGYVTCEVVGQRMLDIFGTDRWEQDGPGTNNHYHK